MSAPESHATGPDGVKRLRVLIDITPIAKCDVDGCHDAASHQARAWTPGMAPIYRHGRCLPHARADADALAARHRTLGFAVETLPEVAVGIEVTP